MRTMHAWKAGGHGYPKEALNNGTYLGTQGLKECLAGIASSGAIDAQMGCGRVGLQRPGLLALRSAANSKAAQGRAPESGAQRLAGCLCGQAFLDAPWTVAKLPCKCVAEKKRMFGGVRCGRPSQREPGASHQPYMIVPCVPAPTISAEACWYTSCQNAPGTL